MIVFDHSVAFNREFEVRRHCVGEDSDAVARHISPILKIPSRLARRGFLPLFFTFHPGAEAAPGSTRPPLCGLSLAGRVRIHHAMSLCRSRIVSSLCGSLRIIFSSASFGSSANPSSFFLTGQSISQRLATSVSSQVVTTSGRDRRIKWK